MNSFSLRFGLLILFAVVWFCGYEWLHGYRACRFKGQSSQTILMELIYLSGWLIFIALYVSSVTGDFYRRYRN